MDGSAWQVRLLGSVESVSRGLGEVACENSYWMVRWLGSATWLGYGNLSLTCLMKIDPLTFLILFY